MILNGLCDNVLMSRPKLLWRNDNPSSAFASNKDISLDREGYDLLLIEFMTSTTRQCLNVTILINDPHINDQRILSIAGPDSVSRNVSLNDIGIVFSTGYYTRYTTSGTVVSGSGTNYAIPYRIYGYNVWGHD